MRAPGRDSFRGGSTRVRSFVDQRDRRGLVRWLPTLAVFAAWSWAMRPARNRLARHRVRRSSEA